jgi:hypothetical protein
MYQKMTVYAVLAIAIGYLLTSTVPAIITPPEEKMLALSEEGMVLTTPSAEPEVEGKEAQTFEGQFWGEIYQYGFLAVDVAIAVGVYMLARRRFS